jgi:Cytochrome c554 and c-prime
LASVINSLTLILTLLGTSIYAEPLTVIYSGNLDGELEPCGCTVEGDFGGIKRRASILDPLRDQQPEPVVLSSGGLITSQQVIGRIKSEYILKGFAALGYDAIGLQWQDLSYGLEFATQFDLPWVLGNGAHSTIARVRPISRSLDGRLVVLKVFSWLDPDDSPMRLVHPAHVLVQADPEALMAEIRQADRQGCVTVLTTSLPLATVQKKFDLQAIDILLVRASYETFGAPQQVEKTLVLQPGSRGTSIARVDLEIDHKGDVRQWQHTVIPLSQSVPDAPRMDAWYDEYNAAVEQNYLKRVEIRKQHESGASDFAGEAKCKACHPVQHEVWRQSEHAGAYEHLESVNKAYDPECVACHTVGFNKPGGFLDKLITPQLAGVQCESCHGPGRAHAQSAGRQPLASRRWTKERMCAQCHVKSHSPSFSIDTYWPKIAH